MRTIVNLLRQYREDEQEIEGVDIIMDTLSVPAELHGFWVLPIYLYLDSSTIQAADCIVSVRCIWRGFAKETING